MTKALTYVEIDLPDPRCVVHLAFDASVAELSAGFVTIRDTNAAGSVHIWSVVGTASVTTDTAFGRSNYFSLAAGAITTPDSDDYTFGSEDFSVEFYFWKHVAIGTERNICGQRLGVGGANATRSFNIDVDSAGHVRGLVYQGSTEIACTGSTVFGVSSAYHHVSFNRSGSNLLLFVDGVLAASNTISGAINDSSGNLAVGQDGDDTSGRWDGWIDEFTICRYARHVAAFTPEPTFYPADTPALPEPTNTLRFALDTGYLPKAIDAIPSIIEVKIDPAIVSLGVDIGQRATVSVRFRDHRHIFVNESFESGTFWGKFRAYYGLRISAYPFRVITGQLGQSLEAMETRHFAIESTDGPSAKGEFQIIAKDVLKFADGDRAQAPSPTPAFLAGGFSSTATSLTLAPSGVGNAEWGSTTSGFISIGGVEACFFSGRSGDTMNITRGDLNTNAVGHSSGERVQRILWFDAETASNIINILLTIFAEVPRSYIDLISWQNEVDTFVNTVYTAYIAEPTPVADLISELIEQVGLSIWWDDVSQQIKLQALRPVASAADLYDANLYLAGSLEITEQPEKRLTRILTYFAQLNPLAPQDQPDNYISSAFEVDEAAEASYGQTALKKIFSRWIPEGGAGIATSLNQVLLARFRDPPRRIAFNILRGSGSVPTVGVGYQVSAWPFQNRDGSAIMVPAQITRLNPRADIFEIELEELQATAAASIGSPGVHVVIIDGSINNVNLRDLHDSLYSTPISGNEVRCIINAGVVVGSTSVSHSALNVGTWPSGITVSLTVNGRIEGAGGAGGSGSGTITGPGIDGSGGGIALFTRKAITLISADGQIWGGGGGGGGGGSVGNVSGQPLAGGNGGGGGAGTVGGPGAPGGGGVNLGQGGLAGSDIAGGSGSVAPRYGGNGGTGGGPGLVGAVGENGPAPTHTNGGLGGAAGAAIDGISFVTTSGGAGDRRGGQIN